MSLSIVLFVEDHIHLGQAINYLQHLLILLLLTQIVLDTLFVFYISIYLPSYFLVHKHPVLALTLFSYLLIQEILLCLFLVVNFYFCFELFEFKVLDYKIQGQLEHYINFLGAETFSLQHQSLVQLDV